MHQIRSGCVAAIHSAQADSATSTALASRVPQSEGTRWRQRHQSHGPRASETVLPATNAAITAAPRAALPASTASMRAEYSSRHGMRAHNAPASKGARLPEPRPGAPGIARTRIHAVRARWSPQAGCRACHTSVRPTSKTPRWNKVQKGRAAAVAPASHPTPWNALAATVPSVA